MIFSSMCIRPSLYIVPTLRFKFTGKRKTHIDPVPCSPNSFRMLSLFDKLLSHAAFFFERLKGASFVLRDELNENPSSEKVKKGGFLRNRGPLLGKEEGEKKRNHGMGIEEEKGVIRVKVKMTKEAAARLLSNCKDGGVLEFRDVARELAQIPVNRVSIVPHSSASGYGMLKTIHEEI